MAYFSPSRAVNVSSIVSLSDAEMRKYTVDVVGEGIVFPCAGFLSYVVCRNYVFGV
jgi:hypothetical protein